MQTDYMALPHLSASLGLSQRPWSHTLSLAGYLPLPRPRHSLQREQLEYECDHWCITFQFQCHPILEDCKWDEGRDESSSLSEIHACRVLWNFAKELEITVDEGGARFFACQLSQSVHLILNRIVECVWISFTPFGCYLCFILFYIFRQIYWQSSSFRLLHTFD